jgi:hypothetical protein
VLYNRRLSLETKILEICKKSLFDPADLLAGKGMNPYGGYLQPRLADLNCQTPYVPIPRITFTFSLQNPDFIPAYCMTFINRLMLGQCMLL